MSEGEENKKIVRPSKEKKLLDSRFSKAAEFTIEHQRYDGIIKMGVFAANVLYDRFFRGMELNRSGEPLKDKEKIERWVKILSENAFMPYGLGCVFSEISEKRVVFNIFKCSIPDLASNVPNAACLFHQTLYSALWKKIFPKGEVILAHSMGFGAPTCDFKCVTEPTKNEIVEIKKALAKLKEKSESKRKVAKFE